MREVCSSAEGGEGDLPKVTKLGRGQLSWGSNPGGGEGESPAAAQESWKVLSFLSLPCPLLNLGGRGTRVMQRELTSWDASGVTSKHYFTCTVILTTL